MRLIIYGFATACLFWLAGCSPVHQSSIRGNRTAHAYFVHLVTTEKGSMIINELTGMQNPESVTRMRYEPGIFEVQEYEIRYKAINEERLIQIRQRLCESTDVLSMEWHIINDGIE